MPAFVHSAVELWGWLTLGAAGVAAIAVGVNVLISGLAALTGEGTDE